MLVGTQYFSFHASEILCLGLCVWIFVKKCDAFEVEFWAERDEIFHDV